MNRDERIQNLHALRDGGPIDALADYLGVVPGPDAADAWAPAAFALVLCAQTERAEVAAEPDGFADAPHPVKLLAAAAAHHQTGGLHLGQLSLHGLDASAAISADDVTTSHYEGLSDWGGRAGRTMRRHTHHTPLGVGTLNAWVSWTPRRSKHTVSVFTDPLAGVTDSERVSHTFPSIGALILELLDQNTFDFTPSELGTMHPGYAARGQRDVLSDVLASLSATLDANGWY
jgi:hypothetical protein